MAEFAKILQASILDRPAVDQTGLGSARYAFAMMGTPDVPQPRIPEPGAAPSTNNAEAPPDLFAALQQQLGLKLESVRAPVDVFVIDRVEKPSAN